MNLFQHRDIWVGNTGASVLCTNNIVGAHNVHKPPLVTTLGQHDTAVTASKLAKIYGQWCNQYGDELAPACLINVRYNPKSNFNLASIVLQKGSTVIKFNIKIETPGGVIWCVYFKHGCKVAAVSGDAQ